MVPARLLAVAAVVVLAIATGPWALWLLWPALVFTGGCGFGRRHWHVRDDFRGTPPAISRRSCSACSFDHPSPFVAAC